MCGIAGIVDGRGRAVDGAMLARMIDVQRHRGPDDHGVYLGEGVGLAHARLAIIDVSSNGRQPISNEDGSVRVVCNGEIYNFRELREQLVRQGHRFGSQTDVEVIPHLYEEAGEDFVQSLRGMFALALWDGPRRRLVLARDRAGQKPLVWGSQDGRLVFASEVKAVVASRAIDTTLDPVAVELIFTYGFAPWPHTMFREIRKLAPATMLIVEDGRLRQHRYWKPRLVPKRAIGAAAAAAELGSLLRETSRLQSVSDVPTGVLLSGGLDSSTVAALFAEQARGPLRTFNVSFDGAADPDRESARAVARALGAAHEEVLVDAKMIDVLPAALWHYDEPYTNPLVLPHFELCRQIKRSATVVHGGEGADELFAGYRGYGHWKWFERFHRVMRAGGAGRAAGAVARALPASSRAGRLARLLSVSTGELRRVKRESDALDARRVYSREFAATVSRLGPSSILDDYYAASGPGPFLDRLLMMDLFLHNAHGVTAFSDALGMAHSVEVRSIFLDHHVIEFAASLPVDLKLTGLRDRKSVLRHAVQDLVPAHVMRRRKIGYGERIPFGRLLDTEWSAYARDVLLGGAIRASGFFDPREVEAVWNEHTEGRRQFTLIWSLVCFGIWCEVSRRQAA